MAQQGGSGARRARGGEQGGRQAHPASSTGGGVSRFPREVENPVLDEEQAERLRQTLGLTPPPESRKQALKHVDTLRDEDEVPEVYDTESDIRQDALRAYQRKSREGR